MTTQGTKRATETGRACFNHYQIEPGCPACARRAGQGASMAKRGGLIGRIYGVDYHRNGVAGAGFHVVTFAYREEPGAVFLATVFDAPGHVAVLRLAGGTDASKPGLADDADRALAEHFRGDNFEAELRAVIVAPYFVQAGGRR